MKFSRHEMLRCSIFGETPLLRISKAQPIIMTHELFKRSIENLGYSTVENEGPFLVENNSGSLMRGDGWEQIGGYFQGSKYGVWISPKKLRLIATWFFVTIILIIPPIILGIWYVVLISKLKQSEINATIIYTGFRREKANHYQLGQPLLNAIVNDLGDLNGKVMLPSISSFLGEISAFEGDEVGPGELQMTISYSLHSNKTTGQELIESDFEKLREDLMQSMVANSKEFSAVPKEPTFLHSETQINKKDEEFNSQLRFPVKGVMTISTNIDYPSTTLTGEIHNEVEWITHKESKWYRTPNSNSDWTKL
jgi:hypothetical protein